MIDADLTIRISHSSDAPELRRLADLDSRREVDAGIHLVAEQNGTLAAALPLTGGPPFADPFQPTADIVRLLELRARQLRAATRASPRKRAAFRASNPIVPPLPKETTNDHVCCQ